MIRPGFIHGLGVLTKVAFQGGAPGSTIYGVGYDMSTLYRKLSLAARRAASIGNVSNGWSGNVRGLSPQGGINDQVWSNPQYGPQGIGTGEEGGGQYVQRPEM